MFEVDCPTNSPKRAGMLGLSVPEIVFRISCTMKYDFNCVSVLHTAGFWLS